eukprot:365273-Chlamydomonas_euryale.AAC.18
MGPGRTSASTQRPAATSALNSATHSAASHPRFSGARSAANAHPGDSSGWHGDAHADSECAEMPPQPPPSRLR